MGLSVLLCFSLCLFLQGKSRHLLRVRLGVLIKEFLWVTASHITGSRGSKDTLAGFPLWPPSVSRDLHLMCSRPFLHYSPFSGEDWTSVNYPFM